VRGEGGGKNANGSAGTLQAAHNNGSQAARQRHSHAGPPCLPARLPPTPLASMIIAPPFPYRARHLWPPTAHPVVVLSSSVVSSVLKRRSGYATTPDGSAVARHGGSKPTRAATNCQTAAAQLFNVTLSPPPRGYFVCATLPCRVHVCLVSRCALPLHLYPPASSYLYLTHCPPPHLPTSHSPCSVYRLVPQPPDSAPHSAAVVRAPCASLAAASWWLLPLPRSCCASTPHTHPTPRNGWLQGQHASRRRRGRAGRRRRHHPRGGRGRGTALARRPHRERRVRRRGGAPGGTRGWCCRCRWAARACCVHPRVPPAAAAAAAVGTAVMTLRPCAPCWLTRRRRQLRRRRRRWRHCGRRRRRSRQTRWSTACARWAEAGGCRWLLGVMAPAVAVSRRGGAAAAVGSRRGLRMT